MNKKLVSIVMGSDSDLPEMKQAAEMLDKFGIGYEIDIVSAHRTPEKLYEFASNAHNRGIVVIIAGAGPGGVPVATVALNGAKNAGILAAQIVSAMDNSVRSKILKYKQEMKEHVLLKSKNLKS